MLILILKGLLLSSRKDVNMRKGVTWVICDGQKNAYKSALSVRYVSIIKTVNVDPGCDVGEQGERQKWYLHTGNRSIIVQA